MGRLCTGGSSEIGPKRGEFKMTERSQCSMVAGGVWGNMDICFGGLLGVDGCVRWWQVVYGGTWIYVCGDSLGLTVVFKCVLGWQMSNQKDRQDNHLKKKKQYRRNGQKKEKDRQRTSKN
jgi:hypothetical protein